ncbi:YbjN domain-containing protein [Phenylobacterium montanum]|uniref:YbjN domain-containing protein n=1 Tax=Phenylobacterium montanum TaxID=2823693 RepID=A0A975G0X6_9CAUL|nr:YbjN domain-containing protein [Caulobacter sp. S6]QUD88452.1 YbjN domain-containing protein [Caulobacter sp. S6]
MTRVILALLAATTLASPAVAQPAMISRWDSGQLVNVLQSLGVSEIHVGELGGRPAVTGRTREGLSVGLFAKGCDAANPPIPVVCHSIEGAITYDAAGKPDRTALANQLNHDYALGKFMAEPDGTIRGSRYFMLDGGVSEENLRAELNGYFAVGALASRAIWPQGAAR